MFHTFSNLRRLLITSCVAVFIIPDITKAATSLVEIDRENLQQAINQYIFAISKMDSDRLEEGHKLDRKTLEATSKEFKDREKKLYADFKIKRDRLAAKLADDEKRESLAGSNLLLSKDTVHAQPASALPATVGSTSSEDLEKHQKWIAEQDKKESDRQAAAWKKQQVEAENERRNNKPAVQPTTASNEISPTSCRRKAYEWLPGATTHAAWETSEFKGCKSNDSNSGASVAAAIIGGVILYGVAEKQKEEAEYQKMSPGEKAAFDKGRERRRAEIAESDARDAEERRKNENQMSREYYKNTYGTYPSW